MQLLWRLPLGLWLALMAAAILLLEIFVTYKVYVKYLKWLSLSLLSYVVVAFLVKQDWGEIVASTLIPRVAWSHDYLLNIVALLGTTISPYLFFWQASQEVEEEVADQSNQLTDMNAGEPTVTPVAVRRMKTDTLIGMIFSNVMTFFIIICAAATLGAAGLTEIGTAAEAAEVLRPLAGELTYLLFTLGIIGTGLLAVPVLAGSASYALAEAIGWRSGLYRKPGEAHGFYGILAVATVAGLLVNFLPVPPFKLLYYTAVLNGLLAPPLLVIIILLANDPKVTGSYRSTPVANALGWIVAAVMAACAAGLLVQFVRH